MSSDGGTALTYDRQLLLLGPKRNAVLELWEVLRYGTDSYRDLNYASVYGLPPAAWYARGIRLLGRTVVECTRDRLADAIGQAVAAAVASAPGAQHGIRIAVEKKRRQGAVPAGEPAGSATTNRTEHAAAR